MATPIATRARLLIVTIQGLPLDYQGSDALQGLVSFEIPEAIRAVPAARGLGVERIIVFTPRDLLDRSPRQIVARLQLCCIPLHSAGRQALVEAVLDCLRKFMEADLQQPPEEGREHPRLESIAVIDDDVAGAEYFLSPDPAS